MERNERNFPQTAARIVAALHTDREALRTLLLLIESLLPHAKEAWFPLRELAHSLIRRLQSHLEQEEYLLGPEGLFQKSVLSTNETLHALLSLREEHQDQRLTVRLLQDLLADERGAKGADRAALICHHLIDSLREHLTHEEKWLLPSLAQELEEDSPEILASHLKAIVNRHYPKQ